MKTKALRLYGKNDLRLEEFELPQINDDEILCKVVSDSICMSSYKAVIQGEEHKRVPKDIANNPIIIGHEFCGEIINVGSKWKDKFKPGDKFAIQPALNYKGSMDAPGYSFPYCGGAAQYIILPHQVMETNSLLKYQADAFFYGSLAEPMSCILAAFHANYHTTPGSYIHKMGIKYKGNMIITGGAGPMGLGAIDYAVNGPINPSFLVVTDIDSEKLNQAASIITVEKAREKGISLYYVNTNEYTNPAEYLRLLTDNHGFDDAFVFAPVRELVELADSILAFDGCLNFFAGPTRTDFSAELNFYNIHYSAHHLVGTSGGNTDDMIESLDLMAKGKINPASMITHIGGLDSAGSTILNLPKIPGGKKLIYTNISMELTAIFDFRKKGETDPLFASLADILDENNGIWCEQAEKYLLENAKPF